MLQLTNVSVNRKIETLAYGRAITEYHSLLLGLPDWRRIISLVVFVVFPPEGRCDAGVRCNRTKNPHWGVSHKAFHSP